MGELTQSAGSASLPGLETGLSSITPPPARVLLIEDNILDAHLVEELLTADDALAFRMDWARSLREGLEKLRAEEWDLVLLDLTLPDSWGLQTCTKIRAVAPTLPVVVLSGATNEVIALKALQEGAQDYLVKGHTDAGSFKRALRHAIERKRIAQELADERNRLRALIDALPDHIYVKDATGRFIVCNTAGAKFFGVSPADVAGKTDFDFFPPSLAQQFQAEEEGLFQGANASLHREAAVRDAAGAEHWVLTTKVALRNSHGPVTGLVGINRDITVRKKALTQLEQLNIDLARSQSELVTAYMELRTANAQLKTAQERLIQAAKMESVGRLASGVAHEVKNPLAILLMGVEYLAEELHGKAGPDVAMTVAQMYDAVHRADAIVRGLLDYASVSQLHLVPGDLARVLEQALLLVRHQLVVKQITVVRQYEANLPPLLLDASRLEQVFINLFTNATQAMPANGQLLITTRTEPLPAGPQVIVQIEDTGPGIPPETLAKIFDPFFTTKPTGQGTGLGLTVSRNIVELHGGTLTLANRPTGGVCATVTFNPQPQGEPHEPPPHPDGG